MKVPDENLQFSAENHKTTEIKNLLIEEMGNDGPDEEKLRLQIPGVSRILPSLYLCGLEPLTQSLFDQLGVTFVVNAAPEFPDTPHSPEKQLYMKINILDRADANMKPYFKEVADMIAEVRKIGGVALIHCVAGASRSASLVIAYLMKYMNMSLKGAYNYVKNERPQIRPNIGFFRQLIAYEEELRGNKSIQMIFLQSIGSEIPDVYEPEYRPIEEYYQQQRQRWKSR